MKLQLQRVGCAGLAGALLVGMVAPTVQAQSPFMRGGVPFSNPLQTVGQAWGAMSPWMYAGYGYRNADYSAYPYAMSSPIAGSMYSTPYAAAMTTNPYGVAGVGYDPYSSMYSNPYAYDPYMGYSWGSGAAAVISANGRLMVNQQQAFLMKEQVRAERILNRRRILDGYLYEREKTPTAEEDRQKFQREQLERSRNNPPITEIWSGKALNDILSNLIKHADQTSPARGFQVPLDEEGLKHINVSSKKSAGNIGILKNEGRITWPVALSGPDYKEERDRVSALTQEAVKQAEFNSQVDAGTVRQLLEDVANLHRQLRANVGDLPPSIYIEGKSFLNNLDDGVTALQQRDAGNYFTGKYALRAKSIPELVKFMSDMGLLFAPATPGDEAAYVALHRALAAYDLGNRRQPTAER